jgi:hypothetical protein
MPLRASEHDEAVGMDVVYHGEEAYPTGEGAILVMPDPDGERSWSRTPASGARATVTDQVQVPDHGRLARRSAETDLGRPGRAPARRLRPGPRPDRQPLPLAGRGRDGARVAVPGEDRGRRYPELEAAIRELHSYDEPEIVATPIVAGTPGYLDWIGESLSP